MLRDSQDTVRMWDSHDEGQLEYSQVRDSHDTARIRDSQDEGQSR